MAAKDPVDVREQFQVAGDRGGRTFPLSGATEFRSTAENIAAGTPWPAYTNVRVQRRIVSETPWEDVADE
jgi:hypothetical protein